jgi:murein DD-endopeptidase MepM/ murein hydrolase activator NlpD
MTWKNPLPYQLVPSSNSDDFQVLGCKVGIPTGNTHPGAFAFKRANHIHEGVDLYCFEGSPVSAVEDGVVVGVQWFTGEKANPPSPWWHNTQAVLVEGSSGVVVYGEILTARTVGQEVKAGDLMGVVKKVLKINKGRPMSMLHLELHQHGTRDTFEWLDERPASLLDPTAFLLELAEPSFSARSPS